jgi:hypothetical protein
MAVKTLTLTAPGGRGSKVTLMREVPKKNRDHRERSAPKIWHKPVCDLLLTFPSFEP